MFWHENERILPEMVWSRTKRNRVDGVGRGERGGRGRNVAHGYTLIFVAVLQYIHKLNYISKINAKKTLVTK